MASFDIFQVDAFAETLFRGNPAAVVVLDKWLPDETMLSIALENNLAETAFVIRVRTGHYQLRWFTPGIEVPLCGHATLATSHVLYTELGETAEEISYETLSGILRVSRAEGYYVLDLPASDAYVPAPHFSASLTAALGATPSDIVDGTFLLAVFAEAATVRNMTPDMTQVLQLKPANDHQGCVLVTAPGDEGYDFVSRLFAPGIGIPEDPVTGAAHCMISPYWAAKHGGTNFKAWQASPRGGEVLCTLSGKRVILKGKAVTYLRGQIFV